MNPGQQPGEPADPGAAQWAAPGPVPPPASAPPVPSTVPAAGWGPPGPAPTGTVPVPAGPPDGVPAPPRGPGVQAPFAAPPNDRDRRRMWIRLGIGAAVLLVCCLGGVGGIVALVVTGQRAALAGSTQAVDDYLEGLRTHDFDRAYAQLCTRLQDRQSRAQFAAQQGDQIQIEAYTVGTPHASGSVYLVPAQVRLVNGRSDAAEFQVVQQGPSELRICGVTR